MGYVYGHLPAPPNVVPPFVPPTDKPADVRKRILKLCAIRQGQPEFRSKLLSAYGSRCAVTGCNTEPVLEAAHIIPYKDQGPASIHVQNGILLRADLHTLFDRQLIAFRPTDDGVIVEVSPRLTGTEYECFGGQPLFMPDHASSRPSREALNIRLASVPLLT